MLSCYIPPTDQTFGDLRPARRSNIGMSAAGLGGIRRLRAYCFQLRLAARMQAPQVDRCRPRSVDPSTEPSRSGCWRARRLLRWFPVDPAQCVCGLGDVTCATPRAMSAHDRHDLPGPISAGQRGHSCSSGRSRRVRRRSARAGQLRPFPGSGPT